MGFDLLDGGNDVEYNGAGLVEISKTFATQDDFVYGTASVDRVEFAPLLYFRYILGGERQHRQHSDDAGAHDDNNDAGDDDVEDDDLGRRDDDDAGDDDARGRGDRRAGGGGGGLLRDARRTL